MACRVAYKASVEKDFDRLDRAVATKILGLISDELATAPLSGKPLKGEFKGLRSWRTGPYRIIYAVTKDSVLITRVAHRRGVYR